MRDKPSQAVLQMIEGLKEKRVMPDLEDKEFEGDALHRLVLDIEMAVGRNKAGATPLGHAVTMLCEDAWAREQKRQQEWRRATNASFRDA